jgi:Domain of unknown function (DUF4340)
VTRVAVPASVVEKAAEGRLAYLVKKLPEFGSVTDVSKLVLTRGKESYEIEKLKPDKEAESWKLKLPKELAGRTADPSKISNLLFELHSLQAEKLVAEKPAAGDLERYGLSTPQDKVTVTVTKDKKSDDHTYLFGKETDDKTGVYAKQGDRDLVFVVRKSTLEALHGDLLDPTVFTFDAAKVRGLKLTGWQDVVGSPFTIDVDKPAGKDWTVKAPPSYPLDTAKVNTLVANLANLKALRFIMPQGPPKPEYKLEHKDGALEVMIAVEGEKEPITLTVGGPAGTDGLYARTNKLPADVFVIAKAAFEQMKSKPAYLKKE